MEPISGKMDKKVVFSTYRGDKIIACHDKTILIGHVKNQHMPPYLHAPTKYSFGSNNP